MSLEEKYAELSEAKLTAIDIKNRYCEKCIWRHMWGLGAKAPFCEMFPVDIGIPKPNEVQFDGKKCEFYQEEI